MWHHVVEILTTITAVLTSSEKIYKYTKEVIQWNKKRKSNKTHKPRQPRKRKRGK